jgi:hypothetical protein
MEPGSPTSKILYPEWQAEYQAALLERDPKTLFEWVTAAETAIFNRLQAYRITQTEILNGRPSKMLWLHSACSRGTLWEKK